MSYLTFACIDVATYLCQNIETWKLTLSLISVISRGALASL